MAKLSPMIFAAAVLGWIWRCKNGRIYWHWIRVYRDVYHCDCDGDRKMSYEIFDRIAFSERLLEARKRRRLSQSKLADLTGVHQNYICAWETGGGLPCAKPLCLRGGAWSEP